MTTSNNSQIVTIHPPEPHSKKQELLMRAFLFPGITEVFVACGTKFGKSIGASTCLTNAIVKKTGAKWRWIAPIYRQSKIGMDYFRGILPPEPHSRFIESKMQIELPNLKSNIEFWHTQRPEDLEGAGVHGQIGDEAAKMPFAAYISARTTTTFTKGPSMWISTPFGKNWFYTKYREAKEEMEWALKNGRQPTKLAIHAPTSENPLISQDIIDLAKREMPDRLFRQHYLAEFMDSGSVFIGFMDCVEGDDIGIWGAIQQWKTPEHATLDVVMGVDWAKQQDFTVFTAIDYTATVPRLVGIMRFQNMKYTEAIKELIAFSRQFKSVGMILHDRTGVGEAIDDMLGHTGLPFNGITFTNQSKANLINRLMIRFEQRGIVLPRWLEMIKELESYEVEITEVGNMRYNAPQGQHDDIVISLALAVAAAEEYKGENFEVKFLEELPKDKTLDKYYNELLEDNDDDSHLF